MRKRIQFPSPTPAHAASGDWLGLNDFSEVIIRSEEPDSPIESALTPGAEGGWKAVEAGPQTIRLLFEVPQDLTLIHLVFREEERSRTQEFVLRWSGGETQRFQEIVRQQYNFGPGSVEVEDYTVDLRGVRSLEIEINPSISGGDARASMAELRVRSASMATR